jgi:GT2 family glycosyltransferase/MoaA/NifB/PqqE/SkfB family radical SAM enzyme
MPFGLFESLVDQVVDPRKFLLNYSGESTVYPELIPAIRRARATGAAVELVTALAAASEALVDELARSGLTRLTVSIHATDPAAFAAIYRHGSFEVLRARLERFLARSSGVAVDLAFVAMRHNLGELRAVTALAAGLGLASVSIFPVIQRDPLPAPLPELDPAAFRAAVDAVRQEHPAVALTVCNPLFDGPAAHLGEIPTACPGELPAGAAIYSCEQNPWETAHVLANGDVVACEVHDRVPLGNLAHQTLAEVWGGEAYRRFRERYRAGAFAECNRCPWKSAWLPGPMHGEILAARGRSAQLGYGWHDPAGEPHLWASQQAVAVLESPAGAGVLHVHGTLPPGAGGVPNRLSIACNGSPVGEVRNDNSGPLTFGLDFGVPARLDRPWQVEFRTSQVHHAPGDQRDLGFAMAVLASKPAPDRARFRRQKNALAPLAAAVAAIDRAGRAAASVFQRSRPDESLLLPLAPGLSVVIPEWDNPAELAQCLDGLETAADEWPETVEAVVVVNGSPASLYSDLQARHAWVRWQFHERPLGFAGAVAAGIRAAQYDWVYLLNSDAVPDPAALAEAGRCRSPLTFSVASQIYLKDETRFREETNWTRLFVENGLAATHDLIPRSGRTLDHFYAGGGASLFQTGLLRRLLAPRAYHPFYWEDVEWGWRARKLGYRSRFCAASAVRHTQRSTIARHFAADSVDATIRRNRLLFQLRNFTAAGSLDAVLDAMAEGPPGLAEFFLRPRTLAAVARGRLWNHVAPLSDAEVLESVCNYSFGAALPALS